MCIKQKIISFGLVFAILISSFTGLGIHASAKTNSQKLQEYADKLDTYLNFEGGIQYEWNNGVFASLIYDFDNDRVNDLVTAEIQHEDYSTFIVLKLYQISNGKITKKNQLKTYYAWSSGYGSWFICANLVNGAIVMQESSCTHGGSSFGKNLLVVKVSGGKLVKKKDFYSNVFLRYNTETYKENISGKKYKNQSDFNKAIKKSGYAFHSHQADDFYSYNYSKFRGTHFFSLASDNHFNTGKEFSDVYSNGNAVCLSAKTAGVKCSKRTVSAQKFSWKKVSGAAGYQVQISTKDRKKWNTAVKLKSSQNIYTFKNLAAGNEYLFRVRYYKKDADGIVRYSVWSTLHSPTSPKPTVLTKLTAGNKAFTAKWKKASYSGYQVQYATNAKFKDAKFVTLHDRSILKTTVKNLQAKKQYYVRVRSYKSVSKVRYYSTWSAVQKIKTK